MKKIVVGIITVLGLTLIQSPFVVYMIMEFLVD
jgi:hypothetical protein